MGRSLSSYHHGEDSLDFGKIFLFFRRESFLGCPVLHCLFLCGSFPQAAVLQARSMWSHHGLGGISAPEPPSTSLALVSEKLFIPCFSSLRSPTPPVPFLKHSFPEVPPSQLYPVHSIPISQKHTCMNNQEYLNSLHTFNEFFSCSNNKKFRTPKSK